jgi:hypothetical protein
MAPRLVIRPHRQPAAPKELDMRYANTSVVRSSVASALALMVMSLIAWSYDSYSSHLYQRAHPSAGPLQALVVAQPQALGG